MSVDNNKDVIENTNNPSEYGSMEFTSRYIAKNQAQAASRPLDFSVDESEIQKMQAQNQGQKVVKTSASNAKMQANDGLNKANRKTDG